MIADSAKCYKNSATMKLGISNNTRENIHFKQPMSFINTPQNLVMTSFLKSVFTQNALFAITFERGTCISNSTDAKSKIMHQAVHCG